MEKNKNQYQAIIDRYRETTSIKQIAKEFDVSVTKVRRILITEGLWSSRSSQKVGELRKQGLSTSEIAEKLGLSEKAVESYLPYSKGAYDENNRSESAMRSEAYRERNASAAGRQVNKHAGVVPLTDRAAVPTRSNSNKSDFEVMLLHLELFNDYLPEKEKQVLRRYGHTEHGITRDILVPDCITLHALHYAIQRAFGWQNSHLHHYELPEAVFSSLIGNSEDKLEAWEPLCGIYFRFEKEEDQDLFWDDDYDGSCSPKSWLRRKYTWPYYYGGFSEYFVESKLRIQQFHKMQRGYGKEKAERLKTLQEYRLNRLLEKIPVKKLLFPEGEIPSDAQRKQISYQAEKSKTLPEDVQEKLDQLRKAIMEAANLYEVNPKEGEEKYLDAVMQYRAFVYDYELETIPVADELNYHYDYGDGWVVKITCKETFSVVVHQPFPTFPGFAIMPIEDSNIKQSAKIIDKGNCLITGKLQEQIIKVITNQRPLCINAEGLNVMDDVGGIGGYCDFLREIHEADDKTVKERLEWAKEMGWTGKKQEPEKVL